MPDKSFWKKLPGPVRWIRGDVLWEFLKWFGGFIFTAAGGKLVLNEATSVAVGIGLLGLGLFLFISAAFGKRRRPTKQLPLGPSLVLLKIDCDYSLEKYRELDQLDRDRVALPLARASVPQFGSTEPPWDYTACMLFHLWLHTSRLVDKAEIIWGVAQWPERLAFFSRGKSESTLMVHLLTDLTELQQQIKEKLALLAEKDQ